MDWTPVIVAAIAAVPPSLIGYFVYRTSQNALVAAQLAASLAAEAKAESQATSKNVDGMKSELVAAVKENARAEGVVVGREEGAAAEGAIAVREADAHAAGVQAGVQNQIDRDTPPKGNGTVVVPAVTVPIEDVSGVVMREGKTSK